MRRVFERLLIVLTVIWLLICAGFAVYAVFHGGNFQSFLFLFAVFAVPAVAVWTLFYALVWVFAGLKPDGD